MQAALVFRTLARGYNADDRHSPTRTMLRYPTRRSATLPPRGPAFDIFGWGGIRPMTDR